MLYYSPWGEMSIVWFFRITLRNWIGQLNCLFENYLIGDMIVLPTKDYLSSSNAKFVCWKICSYSQVESSFGTPSFAPSALLWFCSLILFSCTLSSGSHVLQFYVPKSKEIWIVHIDISCDITTNKKILIKSIKPNLHKLSLPPYFVNLLEFSPHFAPV